MVTPRIKLDSSGLLTFTCYGVDPNAFDPESFRWRQLSVGVLHNLVVPHIPTLGFTHINTCLMASNSDIFSLRSPETESPLPGTWSCGSCPSSSHQSTPDCPEGRAEWSRLLLGIMSNPGIQYLCTLKLVTVDQPSADHGACASW